MYKTGGGQSSFTSTSVKEKVMCLLGDKMDPLFNVLDSDTDYRGNLNISFNFEHFV